MKFSLTWFTKGTSRIKPDAACRVMVDWNSDPYIAYNMWVLSSVGRADNFQSNLIPPLYMFIFLLLHILICKVITERLVLGPTFQYEDILQDTFLRVIDM